MDEKEKKRKVWKVLAIAGRWIFAIIIDAVALRIAFDFISYPKGQPPYTLFFILLAEFVAIAIIAMVSTFYAITGKL